MNSHGPNSAFESETFGEDLSVHVEQPVGSMSISPCARDVVLASKEGLHVIDLDSPYSPPRYLPHRTSWEVADVQWSPFAARDFWVVSTSNQKAVVWNLGMKSPEASVEFVLHGHTRAITDINFSAHHPDVLATCAVDSFIHCWDLRIPTRPVISFSDWFAGATQVKWNRQISHVIASSHDKYLHIWDDRMGAYPVRSIEAHDTKIYGIDWNRHEQNRIVTCSLDKSIKFWDCNNLEDIPERIINTSFPAWRARHTPFGSGLLAMPQRGNGDLHLYDRRHTIGQHINDAVPPVARFEGHKGQVKEFLWRPRGTVIDGVDHREYQLVTWGTDQELRLHKMIPETLSAVGYQKGATQTARLNFTRQGAIYKTFRDEPSAEDFDDVFESQAGSSPTAGHSFRSRPRASTSVGMSKVATPHSTGWLQGSIGTNRIGMHGRNSGRQVMNPIDWMKNVKISPWNPETLGEEIAQVGGKFTKVAFEKVDMSQRKAVISMHAPWGNLNSPIFIKVDTKFPTAYPFEAAAIFNVQKTAAMTDRLAGTLSTELRTISETYVSRRRGCLEAVLRYLLREQDMEQIVSWILDESMDNIKSVDDIEFPEDISSDEEDVGVTTFPGPAGIIDSSSVINANARMPVPRTCGASWADNGKLVCFFVPQSKQAPSFLDLLGTQANDSDRSDNVFEGFGRLQTESPGARTTLRTVTSGEDQTSEISDDSSFTSSSSSGSSDSLSFLPTRLLPKNALLLGRAALPRSRSADHSAQSVIGFSKDKLASNSSINMVSIHDHTELIPSKRELAMGYIIFGKGPEICSHNADVAFKYGYKDVAHIWSLIKLILRDEVPLKTISNFKGTSDVLVIARSASEVAIGNDSGVDLSYDGVTRRSRVNGSGHVRWGESGFGGNFLVPALLHHFESLGDVQMLAMLSCVLSEPRNSNSLAILSQPRRHQSLIPSIAPMSYPNYHPSVEVARSIIDKASTTSLIPGTTTVRISEISYMTLTERGSTSNPTTPYSTGTTPPHPVLHLPTDRRRSSRLSSVDVRDNNHQYSASIPHPGPVSLSTSVEDTRSAHHPNSKVAFPLSRASLSALAPSFSQSPPNASNGGAGHKRSSPVGSLMGNYASSGGWTASNMFGGSGLSRGKLEAGAQTARPRGGTAHLGPSTMLAHSKSLSSDGDTTDRVRGGRHPAPTPKSRSSTQTYLQSKSRNGAKRRVKVKSSLHNQTLFDGDGYANVPMLDPSLEWKYRAYRASYAHLLAVWDLHTQRAEILKFDDLPGSSNPKPKGVIADRSLDGDELALGNTLRQMTIDATRNTSVPNRGLEILRPCNQCGEMLKAIEKNGRPIGWHCAVCLLAQTKSSTKTLCVICTKSVAGLMVPCMNCGHVTCFDCQRRWLLRDNSVYETDDAVDVEPLEADEKSCPTGCGCLCSTYQFVTAPYPSLSEDEEEADDGENDVSSQTPLETLTASEAADIISTHAPRTAMDAFLSLSRARSISSSKAASSDTGKTRSHLEPPVIHQQGKNESTGDAPQTDAWAIYANMGKGLGAGLTRTALLRERGSSTTIRRDSEAQARLRRAGSMYD